MSVRISERSFEEAIECGLLQHAPDACAGDAGIVREPEAAYGGLPGGDRKRSPDDYDRAPCLLRSKGPPSVFLCGDPDRCSSVFICGLFFFDDRRSHTHRARMAARG
jgi:hypothetical protein